MLEYDHLPRGGMLLKCAINGSKAKQATGKTKGSKTEPATRAGHKQQKFKVGAVNHLCRNCRPPTFFFFVSLDGIFAVGSGYFFLFFLSDENKTTGEILIRAYELLDSQITEFEMRALLLDTNHDTSVTSRSELG